MTGMYNEKQISVRDSKDSAPSSLRCGIYELCGSAVCAVLLTLAGWGGMILLDRLLRFIAF